jgi:predicted permease
VDESWREHDTTMWKYQELLNQNLQILITIAVGAVGTWLGPFQVQKDLPTLNKVVFNILLPSAVLLALGINSDLRDGDLWRFIGGFLLLRAFCLVLNVAYYGIVRKRSLAFVTINWMVTCWVSTVVLGIPLLIATLGPQYGSLGAVAGISSFIFQLPLMLIFFEGSVDTPGIEERRAAKKTDSDTLEVGDTEGTQENTASPHHRWYHVSISRTQARYIAIKLVRNPILWSIVIGIILSVSSLGPKYLATGVPQAPNCSYAVGAGFIQLTLSYFARCTEPIALLSVGIFLFGKNPIACGIIQSIIYMIVKLILVPGLMVGCAFAVGLSGPEGRASVLLASLPVSPTAYTVADKYGVGRDIAESNIFFGNLLVLPTTIAWNAFMDAIGLFPAAAPPSVTSSCS